MSDDEKINELRLAFVRQDRKISELEKKYSDISDLYVQLEEENGDRCREIAELKEKFEEREKHQFQDYFKIQRFEEVLRELCQRMGDAEDLEDLGYDLLEKLDGSGGEEQ